MRNRRGKETSSIKARGEATDLQGSHGGSWGNESVVEALRRWGIHSRDLTRISRTVEEGAIVQFKAHRSRKPKVDFSEDEVLRLKSSKERLERTVIEQAAELALIKKTGFRVE